MQRMDPKVSRAIEFHRNGELTKALELYKAVLKEKEPACSVFLNASSILRGNEQHKEAIDCLIRGLKLYPREPGLWNNLGNIYMDGGNTYQAINSFRRSLSIDSQLTDPLLSLAVCLREVGCQHLSYALIRDRFKKTKDVDAKASLLLPLIETILAIYSSEKNTIQPEDMTKIINKVELEVKNTISKEDPCRANLVMTQIWMQVENLDNALTSRETLQKNITSFLNDDTKDGKSFKKSFAKNWNGLNWNLSIKLLKKGRFKEGWGLYDYGLQVSAQGPQRWQRSLNKPYSGKELRFWKGESLRNKKILILGEQGIGDTMMFATLLNKLSEEGAIIYFCPGDRLISIYKRSFHNFKVLSLKELKESSRPTEFDYQTPIGSICQYRFHDIQEYGNRKSMLVANKKKTDLLRNKYYDGRPLVGISWQGGGKASRIPLKSLSLMQLKPILERQDVRFVSLQYGDDKPHLQKFENSTGIKVLHDDKINPLNDMDTWLCQVAAMDAVLSIANTTVHGSGGCGIPTLCLVSHQSDWRWIDPEVYKGCYWYDSVEARYQSPEGDWGPALANASKWLDSQFAK